MNIRSILETIGIRSVNGELPTEITLVTADSRKVIQGSVFVAVKGNSADGHAFIPSVLEKGAAVVVYEDEIQMGGNAAFVRMASSRKALSLLALAQAGNPQEKLTIVGVTGTNGKTTISTLVWQVLNQLGVSCGLLGTVQKAYGTEIIPSKLTTAGPEELAADLSAMVKAGCTHLAMEVSSHALDQDRTFGLNFAVGVFTNLTHDHLDYHQTFGEYARAKKKLFDALQPEAFAVVNADDAQAAFMTSDCPAQTFGISFSETSGNKIISNSVDGLMLDLDGTTVTSPLSGTFNAYNVAQAWMACVSLGISETNAAAALSTAHGAVGRLQPVHSNADSVRVFVDYAHTPDALRNVLQTLASIPGRNGNLTVIFGCGGDRDATKRPLMAGIAETFADVVVVTSDNPRTENPTDIITQILTGFSHPEKVQTIEDRSAAIHQTILKAQTNDVVLVAGKGHENYQEINGVRYPMDDVLLSQEALSMRKRSTEGTK